MLNGLPHSGDQCTPRASAINPSTAANRTNHTSSANSTVRHRVPRPEELDGMHDSVLKRYAAYELPRGSNLFKPTQAEVIYSTLKERARYILRIREAIRAEQAAAQDLFYTQQQVSQLSISELPDLSQPPTIPELPSKKQKSRSSKSNKPIQIQDLPILDWTNTGGRIHEDKSSGRLFHIDHKGKLSEVTEYINQFGQRMVKQATRAAQGLLRP